MLLPVGGPFCSEHSLSQPWWASLAPVPGHVVPTFPLSVGGCLILPSLRWSRNTAQLTA